MKERPILFNGEMVRAILEGRKTQTRRLMKYPLAEAAKRILSYKGQSEFDCVLHDESGGIILCPHGKPGDRLWVRETWGHNGCLCCPVHYRATEPNPDTGNPYFHCRPSIHMPRWASRITLEITEIRVERLNAITGEDAEKEGVERGASPDHTKSRFMNLWQSINGLGSWGVNPWVWVIEFRKVGV